MDGLEGPRKHLKLNVGNHMGRQIPPLSFPFSLTALTEILKLSITPSPKNP